MNKTLLSLAAAFALTGAAIAQDATFADIDTDQSGDLSFAELTVTMPDLTMEAFTAADVDANGAISEEEYATLSAGTEG
ncbi:hypothetical protein [Mariluticola halotolerans]|uniref:hypothetical protein n=1 Tax=Mariluticola halotolerans TaxID=2909283 RepID=UPI0026E21CFE|nr:hypothetical protein [Mariluticola halotolerans]UJQ93657.1 hypothetical protein L1P08_11770 [Mariluticola halotolerans]